MAAPDTNLAMDKLDELKEDGHINEGLYLTLANGLRAVSYTHLTLPTILLV